MYWTAAAILLSLASAAGACESTGVRVRVTDLLGSVLPGATVTVSQGEIHRSVVGGSSGEAIFDALPPGLYSITAYLEGFSRASLPVSIGPCESRTVDLGLALHRATDHPKCQVTGTVSTAGHESFVAGVEVVASLNPGLRVEPRYKRHHRFEALLPEPGRYLIVAHNDRYGTAAIEVTCDHQRAIDVSMKLR